LIVPPHLAPPEPDLSSGLCLLGSTPRVDVSRERHPLLWPSRRRRPGHSTPGCAEECRTGR
jgi:hypothetical protein